MRKQNQQDLADHLGLGLSNANLTEADLLNALKESELLEDGAIDKMYAVGRTAFHLMLNNQSEPLEIAAAMYPIERLFHFYYLLANAQRTAAAFNNVAV